MMKKMMIIVAGLLLISLNVFADDVSIDSSGNVKTGVSNANAELEVTGGSAEGAIRGMASGTFATGVYGVRTDNGNYGTLGSENYGVFGQSQSGYAGYFKGNARVSGDLTVDGSIIGPVMGDITGVTAGTGLTGGGTSGAVTISANIGTGLSQVAAGNHAHNYDSAYVNEGQADSITSGMIVDGAGSTLDADLLDGQHAAAFSSATHDHTATYVQKAGDTMTGTLILPANGLTVGGTQLVLSGGKVGVGAAPSLSGKFQVLNPDETQQAGYFKNSNSNNILPAVYAHTTGSGQALFGLNQGTGRAGHFQILNAANSASALVAQTNGTGYAGEFLGNVTVAGTIETTSGGIKFPDGTVQTTASAPTWHQILPAAERFVLVMNNNEAVLDKETGLVWDKAPSTSYYTWSSAISHCANSNVGRRKGWHLPTVEQLASLVDSTQSDPVLPSGHPFIGVQSGFYWAATTSTDDPTRSWNVNFSYGGVVNSYKAGSNFAWCVRGGQSHDAY